MGIKEGITSAAKEGVESGMKSASKSTVNTILKPFLFLFSKIGWQLSITLILLIFIFAGAVIQSVKQKSPYPIFFEVGGRLVSSDEVLYQDITTLRLNPEEAVFTYNAEEGGFFNRIKHYTSRLNFWFNIITQFWFIYMNFYMFHKLIKWLHGQVIPGHINWLWTIFVLFTLQMIFSLTMFSANMMRYEHTKVIPGITDQAMGSMGEADAFKFTLHNCIPFKGVLTLGVYMAEQIQSRASNINIQPEPAPEVTT